MRHNTVFDLISAQANLAHIEFSLYVLMLDLHPIPWADRENSPGLGGGGVLGVLTDNDIFLVVNIFYIAGPLGPPSRSNSELDQSLLEGSVPEISKESYSHL